MKIVLLSGCSGWRLWPLSNESRSKQFLKLLTGPDGTRESMLQRIKRQIVEAGIAEKNIYVVTAESQAHSIRSQIGDEIKTIIEPERRDTFPAIAMACVSLYLKEKMPIDDTVVVLPVDTFAENGFYELIGVIDKTVQNEECDMAILGTNPTYPSAKYGYMVPDSNSYVSEFVEKPSEDDARRLIDKGALWNMGAVGFKLSYAIDELRKYVSDKALSSIETFRNEFSNLPQISFDYEVLEKATNVKVIRYDGQWKDLGTWNTLTEEMTETNIGQSRQGEECENVHVINELSIPILTLGAKDLVVAASPDGILVSDKHKSSYIKPYVQKLDARPMYEERKWGEYKVLDYNQYGDGTKSLTKHLTISAGKAISYQKHFHRDEIWTIVDGTGELLIDDEIRHVKRGDVAYIIKGQKHALKANTDLHFIEVQIGSELAEEDIERFDWNWNC